MEFFNESDNQERKRNNPVLRFFNDYYSKSDQDSEVTIAFINLIERVTETTPSDKLIQEYLPWVQKNYQGDRSGAEERLYVFVATEVASVHESAMQPIEITQMHTDIIKWMTGLENGRHDKDCLGGDTCYDECPLRQHARYLSQPVLFPNFKGLEYAVDAIVTKEIALARFDAFADSAYNLTPPSHSKVARQQYLNRYMAHGIDSALSSLFEDL